MLIQKCSLVVIKCPLSEIIHFERILYVALYLYIVFPVFIPCQVYANVYMYSMHVSAAFSPMVIIRLQNVFLSIGRTCSFIFTQNM